MNIYECYVLWSHKPSYWLFKKIAKVADVSESLVFDSMLTMMGEPGSLLKFFLDFTSDTPAEFLNKVGGLRWEDIAEMGGVGIELDDDEWIMRFTINGQDYAMATSDGETGDVYLWDGEEYNKAYVLCRAE